LIESSVGKTLKEYYKKKFHDLPEKQQEALVNSSLSNTIPSAVSKIAPRTQMLYGPTPSEESDAEKRINKSGFILVYDSFSEGLEPIYFWVLDFMRDNYWGPGLEVSKTLDQFEASVGGGFFGDMGTRAAVMQDRAMKLIGTINTVVRSIINILYDLKEFDQRLDSYQNLDSEDKEKLNAARLSLKQIWMDKVDIQRGRGSINMLTQQLQFVTLRDAFMATNSTQDVEKMDLNDRVKRILIPRIDEYLAWEKLSRAELTRRYKIERTYLKSQVDSLTLYTEWARPYLQAAQQLKMISTRGADIVNAFNNLVIQVSLFGKNVIKPIKIQEWPQEKKYKTQPEKKYYEGVEISFSFRSIPHTIKYTQTGTHYTQGGRVEVNFRAFGLDEDEIKAIEKADKYEGFEYVEGITTDLKEQIKEDLDKYLKDEEEAPSDPREKIKFLEKLLNKTKEPEVRKEILKKIKEQEKEIKETAKKEGSSANPFSALIGGFKELGKLLPKKSSVSFTESKIREAAKAAAAGHAYNVYHVYKKSHNMYNE